MQSIDDMLLFAKLAELKSFTAVAEALELSRSQVSKRINRLEDQLGVQLLNRSTRRLELTEAGRTFYEYCVQLGNTVQAAQNAVGEIRSKPKGNLNINAPVTYGQTILPAVIVKFLECYPDVRINLNLSDQFIDVIEGGFDIVIRIGELKDSNLKARKFSSTGLHVFAHKKYLEKYGTPKTPIDLQQHNCLTYKHMSGGPNEWHFHGPSGEESIQVKGNFSSANGVPLLKAVQAGLGIAIQPDFMLQDFEDDNIVRILKPYCKQEMGIYAIYPTTRKTPLNTRVFIDFLLQQMS